MRKLKNVTPDKLKQSYIVDYYSTQKALNMDDKFTYQSLRMAKSKSVHIIQRPKIVLPPPIDPNRLPFPLPVCKKPGTNNVPPPPIDPNGLPFPLPVYKKLGTASTSSSQINKYCAGHTNSTTSGPSANWSNSITKESSLNKRFPEYQNRIEATFQPQPQKKKGDAHTTNIRYTTTSNQNNGNQNKLTPSTSRTDGTNGTTSDPSANSSKSITKESSLNKRFPEYQNRIEATFQPRPQKKKGDANTTNIRYTTTSNQNNGNQNKLTPSTSRTDGTNGTSDPPANSSKIITKESSSSKRFPENQNRTDAMSQPRPQQKKGDANTTNIRYTTTSNQNNGNQNKLTPSTSRTDGTNGTTSDLSAKSSKSITKESSLSKRFPENQNRTEATSPPRPQKKKGTSKKNTRNITMSNQNDENQKESTPSTSLTRRATKDENKMNDDFLKMMNDVFYTVLHNPNLVHVIDDKAIELSVILQSAKKEYQYICYKLYTRMVAWHNIFKICNDYMPNLPAENVIKIFNFLKENTFVDTDYKQDSMESLLVQLPAKDLKDICLHLKIKANTTRDKMIETLLHRCRRQPTLCGIRSTNDIIFGEIIKKMGIYVVRINDSFKQHVDRIYLLATFTNRRFQNIQDFLRRDLNRDFPDFVPENYKVFSDRQEFLRYANACELRKTVEVTKNHETLQEIGKKVYETLKTLKRTNDEIYLNAPHLKRFTAESVYCGILTNICEALKTKYADKVQEFLEYLIENFPRSHRIGSWYMFLCDIFISRHLSKEAVNTIITALSTKKEYILEYQIYEFSHKAQQLKKRRIIDQYCHDQLVGLLVSPVYLEDFPQNVVDAKAIRSDQPGRKRHYEIHNSDGSKTYKTVEEVAQDHYIETCGYTHGIHCEGRIIMNSFALFFWEIIYSQNPIIPGTFLSKYQEVPLDMYTTDFYKNRKELIDKRLKDIAEGWTYEETIENASEYWHKYSHLSGLCGPICETIDINFLKIIVYCVGRKMLSKIYERLVKDIRQYQSGMPDLFLWNVDERKAKFVEVKGENDKLSIKQKLWIKYLLDIGANAEVCHVHSRGSKRKLVDNEMTTNE
ncbi:fanconi-associated nuclease 1 homolog isoform X2 [Diabrotica undecimpunctata]|uniref:fanconi-associated nuclease 1 homolog isoform X2 n=1 Tax=Diabrotica undecimpunctata TaxID=50387 RepID=UPI003B63C4D0